MILSGEVTAVVRRLTMKFRFSLRCALILLTAIAAALAWYARNAAVRVEELQALARIEALTWGRMSVSDISAADDNECGAWAGALAYTDQRAPVFLHWLDLDAFRRVTSIEVQHVINPELVAELNAFRHLEHVCFRGATASSEDLASALISFRLSHPHIEVQCGRSELISDDPFGSTTTTGAPFQ